MAKLTNANSGGCAVAAVMILGGFGAIVGAVTKAVVHWL